MHFDSFQHRIKCYVQRWILRRESYPSVKLDLRPPSYGLFNATDATTRFDTNVYVSNKTWAAILLVPSSILLACGIYGAIVKHMMRGPQILGYVSTMTRDNPYINLPSEGCTLDGLERGRLLKDLKTKLRDIAPQDEVGHIALTDAASFNPGRLVSSKLYAGPAFRVKQ